MLFILYMFLHQYTIQHRHSLINHLQKMSVPLAEGRAEPRLACCLVHLCYNDSLMLAPRCQNMYELIYVTVSYHRVRMLDDYIENL
jgi:hypothetical protein